MTRVLLLTTGDTIAYRPGRPDVATGPELLAAAPLDAVIESVVEAVPAEPGWDASPSTMLALARRVRSGLVDEGFDGIVVAHGLDTLEQAAYLTDLLLGPAAACGTVVYTGAARYLDDTKSDGPPNLARSLTAAASPGLRGAGVLVCADGELHASRWATLSHASDTARFTSAPHSPLGLVGDGAVSLAAAPPPRPPLPPAEPTTDVALITVHPGMSPALLRTATDAGARGVVLEGTGAGNVPVELFTVIGELTEWDIPVIIVPRVRASRQWDAPLGAALAAKMGAIIAPGFTATQAHCALMVALGDGGGVDAARTWFAACDAA